jgi:membrane protease YdiL (CAAX protease family)
VSPRIEAAAAAALLLLAVWSVLLAGALLEPHVGAAPSLFASFLTATLLVLATRERVGPLRPGRASAPVLAGFVCGCLSYPAWIALIAAAGTSLGLAPLSPAAPSSEPLLLLSTLLLAPLFEELLYRERLLLSLVALWGWPAAILLSSALFALPHAEAWGVLGTFLVGLALAASRWLGSPLGFCIGAHAGLNLAASLPPPGAVVI